jgi:hypothetical protein
MSLKSMDACGDDAGNFTATNKETCRMWVLTRNDGEALKEDGSWDYWRYTTCDDERLFDSFEAAKSYAEAEGIGEFTRPRHIQSLYRERLELEAKSKQRQLMTLAECEYVALPEPLEFYATTHEYDVPTFDLFIVTHYIVSSGAVCGVLGYGKDDDAYTPFHSLVGDDYDFAFFEVYRLSPGSVQSSNTAAETRDRSEASTDDSVAEV